MLLVTSGREWSRDASICRYAKLSSDLHKENSVRYERVVISDPYKIVKKYPLNPEQLASINVKMKGRGTLQDYLEKLQTAVKDGNLCLTQYLYDWLATRPHLIYDFDKQKYKSGGWQSRIPKEFKDDVITEASPPKEFQELSYKLTPLTIEVFGNIHKYN